MLRVWLKPDVPQMRKIRRKFCSNPVIARKRILVCPPYRCISQGSGVARREGKMGFIIRSVFWLSLVLLLIPFGTSGADGNMVSPLQAMFAAKGAIEDVAGMCERRPDVCTVGKAAIHTIGVRAREGARLAYEALERNGTEDDATVVAGSSDPVADVISSADVKTVTGSVAAR